MPERFHDSKTTKVITPLGMVSYNQRIKTHATLAIASPDPSGGHLSNNGSTVVVPSLGTFDDNIPTVNIESEAISPGPGGSGTGRMIKSASSVLTLPTSPHDKYQAPKIANKQFGGKISF